MEILDLPEFYADMDSQFDVINNNLTSATYTNVDSNFVYSERFARHRWFNYKEGFSPLLVQKIFDEYRLSHGDVVCDPFCGAGTTLAVAKADGLQSIGFEVNPFASFISKVKTDDYCKDDIDDFNRLISDMEHLGQDAHAQLPDNEYLLRLFSPEMLEAQLCIRSYIENMPITKSRNLLYFSWLCILEKCSLYRKAGNGLKARKHPPAYQPNEAFSFALSLIKNKAAEMTEDFTVDDNGPIPIIHEDSATTMGDTVKNNSLDLILFSPPYANCFDYTKIYYLELWFGGFISSKAEQKEIRMKSLRSHCHATWPSRYTNFSLDELDNSLLPLLRKQQLWTPRIPDMLHGYFADMEETLKQAYAALKVGGHCSIVVSNSAYAGIVIPTDTLLAIIARRIGFAVQEISVERLIITSSQQYKKTEHVRKYLRESIVKLEKV